jgi:hypothetical protein
MRRPIMKIFVAIDDTDNIDVKQGTGHLASALANEIESFGWGKCFGVTRHQLFVHPEIPFTSHNSAMCFPAEIKQDCLGEIMEYVQSYLVRESALGSDPGFCLAVEKHILKPDLLVSFGQQAKKTVFTKEDAYGLAERLGIHLSEHGGTGQGVIGALAGVGLRLSGNDGRFRGKYQLEHPDTAVTVKHIYDKTLVDLVRSIGGKILNNDEKVKLGEKIKSVLMDGKRVLLVSPYDKEEHLIPWQTCPIEYIKKNF